MPNVQGACRGIQQRSIHSISRSSDKRIASPWLLCALSKGMILEELRAMLVYLILLYILCSGRKYTASMTFVASGFVVGLSANSCTVFLHTGITHVACYSSVFIKIANNMITWRE